MIAYQWLVMRQGVDTVKPDVHVRKFAEAASAGSSATPTSFEVVTRAAQLLGIKAYELALRIWEASRVGASLSRCAGLTYLFRGRDGNPQIVQRSLCVPLIRS